MRFAAPRTYPCSHYNAIRIPALQNTKGEPIIYALKRSKPQPPHTGGTRHRRLQPPYYTDTEKHKVSFSGFLPNTSQVPCNILAAIAMRLQQHVHIHSARHHFSQSPLPSVTMLRHHPSSSPFAITFRHHFPQSPPFVATFMWCIVLWCTVVWCKVSQFYLSATRKIASQLPLIYRMLPYPHSGWFVQQVQTIFKKNAERQLATNGGLVAAHPLVHPQLNQPHPGQNTTEHAEIVNSSG